MKSLSIGRDVGCDIVLNDGKDLISRRHAILYIYPTGKMAIVDQGQNGTYVNGIKITPNVPFPVSRKDKIMFAHVLQLDWKLVPNRIAQLRNIFLGCVLVVLIVGGGVLLSKRDRSDVPIEKDSINQLVPADTSTSHKISQKQEETTPEEKKKSGKNVALPSKKAEEEKKAAERKKEAARKKKLEQVKKDTVILDKPKVERKDTIVY